MSLIQVLQRSNTNPLNQLEEHDGRGEGGSSELETTSGSLDRRALHSTSSPRHSSVSSGSTGSGLAAARSSSGGNTKKKNQFFSFFKDSTPKTKSCYECLDFSVHVPFQYIKNTLQEEGGGVARSNSYVCYNILRKGKIAVTF